MALEVGDRQSAGHGQRQRREPRRRAHGGKVAQVDGQRPMADRLGRDESAVEVDALDAGVGRDHLERVSLRAHHRRIVAGADEEPVRCDGQAGRDAVDQILLVEIGDGQPADPDTRHFA